MTEQGQLRFETIKTLTLKALNPNPILNLYLR